MLASSSESAAAARDKTVKDPFRVNPKFSTPQAQTGSTSDRTPMRRAIAVGQGRGGSLGPFGEPPQAFTTGLDKGNRVPKKANGPPFIPRAVRWALQSAQERDAVQSAGFQLQWQQAGSQAAGSQAAGSQVAGSQHLGRHRRAFRRANRPQRGLQQGSQQAGSQASGSQVAGSQA
ncbi:MAG TPA: hypothetical protein EYP56_01515, partial [Planctomycetaceae bacterium]|nr:hypothetical protein [Planctomycetaceae bacterium]